MTEPIDRQKEKLRYKELVDIVLNNDGWFSENLSYFMPEGLGDKDNDDNPMIIKFIAGHASLIISDVLHHSDSPHLAIGWTELAGMILGDLSRNIIHHIMKEFGPEMFYDNPVIIKILKNMPIALHHLILNSNTIDANTVYKSDLTFEEIKEAVLYMDSEDAETDLIDLRYTTQKMEIDNTRRSSKK